MYQPQPLNAGSLPALVASLEQELQRLSQALAQPADYAALKTIYAEPKRVFEGMVIKADGTTWDPGSGAGVYAYVGGAWTKL